MTIRVLYVGSKSASTAAELERRRSDLTIETATSAAEALAALPADFDCLVFERTIPTDVLPFLGTVRHRHPNLPIVLISESEDGGLAIDPIGISAMSEATAVVKQSTDDEFFNTIASAIAYCIGADTDRSAVQAEQLAPYQKIVDTIGDGVYTIDADGVFTSVNDTLVEITGYSREELIGQHVSIILDERDIEISERKIKSLLTEETGDVKQLVITVHTASGETIPCENRFSLLPFDEAFRGSVGVIRDVTARKQMENELRESRDKITDLHEVAAELARCETEPDIYERAVSAAEVILSFDICGIDAVEDGYFVPKYTSSGMPGEGTERMSVEDGLAGKTYREGRSIVIDDVRSDDDAKPVQAEYRSILSIPVGDVGVFQAGSREKGAFDETDKELTELLMSHVSEALTRVASESALRESEGKYRTLVEQSRDAVFIYRDGKFAFVNERTCELLGYERSELEGKPILEVIHPDERESVREIVRERTEGKDISTYETRVVTKNGAVRQFEINAQRISYNGYRAVLGSARDVTERKRRKREIERQNDRLHEFTSIVSHDLRNPLNVAQGYLDLAEETGDSAHFDRIFRSLDRMEQLIEDLLAQARHGQNVSDPKPVEIGLIAKQAWQNVDTCDATLDVNEGIRMVEGEQNQVLTLLENLFRNAIEHGGRDVNVQVGPLASGFFVEDDGPGIDHLDTAAIFEHGYSAADGTGLGLAIVESVAEAHGWRIELASASDSGARFEFYVE